MTSPRPVRTHGLTHLALAVQVFFVDPDGYEGEIGYGLPTPVDPVG